MSTSTSTPTATSATTDLLAVASEPHDRALSALDDPWADGLAAVAWCSAHLVAVDCVLYGAVQRHVPGSRDDLHVARAADRLLQATVLRLDRRLTGDVHLAQVPVEELTGDVRDALDEHARCERRLVAQLRALLTAQELHELADGLRSATDAAPTRPHPYTRHTPLSRLVASVDALVDRARDVMDNRVTPVNHRRRQVRPAGRWGCYLMATPYPSEEPIQEEVRP